MRVHMDDGKIAKISGEMLVDGFVAEMRSIKEWERPAGVPIDEKTKAYIIQKVLEKNSDESFHMKFFFE